MQKAASSSGQTGERQGFAQKACPSISWPEKAIDEERGCCAIPGQRHPPSFHAVTAWRPPAVSGSRQPHSRRHAGYRGNPGCDRTLPPYQLKKRVR
jgi:hypothetical protein